ncbi:MAG: hypothetical protein IT245_04150, partial [Bacteroidia bacterium]|nr:hypothetical protein [Bacteroidia bacterium]
MNYDELESEDCTKEEIEELKGTIEIRHLPIDLIEEKYELLTFPEDFYLYNIDDEQSNRYREFSVKYFPYYDDGRYYDLYECGNRVIELILNNELMNNKEKFSLLKKYEIFLEDVLKSSKEDLKHALNEMHKIENEVFEIYSLDMIT